MTWMPHAPWVVDWNAITTTVRTEDGQAVARCYRDGADALKIAAVPAFLNALHEAGDLIAAQLAHGEVSPEGWEALHGQIIAALRLGGCAMTARRKFRVFVHEWTCWDKLIEAETAEQAEEIAQKQWDDIGPEAFSLLDSGTDGIHVDECEPLGVPVDGEGGDL